MSQKESGLEPERETDFSFLISVEDHLNRNPGLVRSVSQIRDQEKKHGGTRISDREFTGWLADKDGASMTQSRLALCRSQSGMVLISLGSLRSSLPIYNGGSISVLSKSIMFAYIRKMHDEKRDLRSLQAFFLAIVRWKSPLTPCEMTEIADQAHYRSLKDALDVFFGRCANDNHGSEHPALISRASEVIKLSHPMTDIMTGD